MDKVSRIDGREYSLIEQLPALVGESDYVVCEDAEGFSFTSLYVNIIISLRNDINRRDQQYCVTIFVYFYRCAI